MSDLVVGHEDSEFWTRVESMTNLYENRVFFALHMDHARPHAYSQNAASYANILAIPMEDRLVRLRFDLDERRKNERLIDTNLSTEM